MIKCFVTIKLFLLGQLIFEGYIKSRYPSVSRERIRSCHKEVFDLRAPLRGRHRRREYYVEGPLHVWHVDGHHKLIRSVIAFLRI